VRTALYFAQNIDPVLDYTQDVPASLNRGFDIVVDANGSLTPAQGDALTKRGGVVVDINPSASKFVRSLLLRRRKVVMGVPTAKIPQKVAKTSRHRKTADRDRPRRSLGRKCSTDLRFGSGPAGQGQGPHRPGGA
jgi:NADPH:quinone reductase-like Zn-dependent oxidoreductase